jgi:hypothetical protein
VTIKNTILKIVNAVVVFLNLFFEKIVIKNNKTEIAIRSDNRLRTMVTSSGKWLTSPPNTSGDELNVIIFGGYKSVFVEVVVFPSSPVKIHHGETKEIIRKAITSKFIPRDNFFFHVIIISDIIAIIIPR